MKAFILAATALFGLSNAVVITNCNTGESYNLGDNQCHTWTTKNWRFQSNSNCEMHMYSGDNCSGQSTSQGEQNVCHTVPFKPATFRCDT